MILVLYLYEFTLLSNLSDTATADAKFYTSMNLHYSQTICSVYVQDRKFYTSMNLHYSQTFVAC